jgi:peptidoglycan/LPS O-acetylase OafA/YrhL
MSTETLPAEPSIVSGSDRPILSSAAASPLPAAPHAVRFRFIDALRGIAALAVCWHHVNLYGPLPDPAATVMPSWLKWAALNGWAGVPTFFVISGFVIAYSVRGAWVTPRFLGNFALRRSLRLDPCYWVMIGLALFLDFLPDVVGLPSPHDNGLSAGQVLTHFVYLQNISAYDNLSAGFWTLCIEMQFYLLFCVMMAVAQRISRSSESNPQPTARVLALVYLPLALVSLYVINQNEAFDDWIIYFFSMFFLGTAAWWTLDRRLPAWVFWGYVAAMAGRYFWSGGDDLPFAVSTGVAIYLIGRAGRLSSCLNIRPLQYLGKISYSLYLIHYPVSHIVVSAGYRLTGDSPWAAFGWLTLSVLLSVLAAHFLYLFVEAPTARLASRLKPRSGQSDPVGSANPSGGHAYKPSPAGA